MKKRLIILLCFIFCLVCCDKVYAAKKVLVVLGSNGFIHLKANACLVKNIDSRLIQGLKTIVSTKNVKRIISRFSPDLVIAIGDNALRQLLDVSHIPVGYILCSDLGLICGKNNFFGISKDFNQQALLKKIRVIIPEIKKIALVYNPEKTEKTINKDADFIQGMSFVPVPVHSSLELAPAIFENVKNVDAILIYPDPDLLTPETMEFLFQFTIESQIPVMSFEGQNPKGYSTVLFGSDACGNGKIMAEMVNDFIKDGSSALKQIENSSISVKVNKRIVKMLKFDLGTGFKTR